MANGVKTTISVREMGRLLGLKKVESYYLVHKGYFKTILVEGRMRVVIDSFEDWYENQDYYHKTEGRDPGEKLREKSLSVKDVSKLLCVSEDLVYSLIRKNGIATIAVGGKKRIPKEIFYEWYRGQDRYRTMEDRERDAALEAASMTMPEMAKLLGVSRKSVYGILKDDNGKTFKIITVAGKKRILLDSFEKWYAGQSKYKKAAGSDDKEVEPDDKEVEPDDEKKLYLTDREAAEMSGYPLTEIQNWIRRGKLRPVKFGSKVIRIKKSDLDQFLSEIGGKNGWLH